MGKVLKKTPDKNFEIAWSTTKSIEVIPLPGGDVRIFIHVRRPRDRIEFMDYSVELLLQANVDADSVARALHGTASEIFTKTNEEEFGYSCPQCGRVFFNFTKTHKIYCNKKCQVLAAVNRFRGKKKDETSTSNRL